MTPEVLVLVGAPASGKSTFAKELIAEGKHIRLNRDDFRMSLYNKQILDAKGEKAITPVIKEVGKTYLRNGVSLVLDNTHCNEKVLLEVIQDFDNLADIRFKLFDVPLSTLLDRNKNRDVGVVPDFVVKKIYQSFTEIKNKFDFSERLKRIIPDLNNEHKKPTVVFDLDNTLALKGNRGIYDFKKVGTDSVLPYAFKLLLHLKMSYDIVFATGRPESCRKETLQWIKDNLSIQYPNLMMRKTSDFRKSYVVKEEMLLELSKTAHINSWFDDDKDVIEMVKSYGIHGLLV